MKKAAVFLTSLLLAAALLFPGATALADEMIKPTDSFFVADYADVIDEADENHIIDRNAALSEATGAQIVIATVEFIGSTPIDDYCYELFNEWGIGDKDKDNGVLLLMVIGAEDYYIMTGTGLGQLLPGGVLGNMLDEYLEPDFASGDYSAGAVKIFDELYDSVAAYYKFGTDTSGQTGGDVGLSAAEPEPTPEPAQEQEKSPKRGSFVFILIVAVILLILISNVRRKARRVTGFNSAPPRGPGSFGAPPPPRGFGAPPRGPGPGSFGGFGGSSYRSSGFSSGRSSAGRSSGFSGGSSRRSGFSGGGGSTRGGGAGRGRR